MKYIYLGLSVVCASGILLLTTGYAQERTAGNSTELQMTWSALNSLVQSANAKIAIVDGKVAQIQLCNKTGLAYAPGPGADAHGCIDNPKILALQTSVANLANITNTYIKNANTCGTAQKWFNGSACVAPTAAGTATFDSCYYKAARFGTFVPCGADEVMTGMCSSGRDADCPIPGGALYSRDVETMGGTFYPYTGGAERGGHAFSVARCCKIKLK